MKLPTTALALLAALAEAGLRFPCSTLTFQRLDPAGEPGSLPSSHVHHIVGGNAFNATMEGDVGERATCTTCHMAEDFSNYWTATLYFKHPDNGTFHRVTPIPVQPLLGGSEGAVGGLTVYYTQFDLMRDNLAQQKITAFPPVSVFVKEISFLAGWCLLTLALGIPYGRWRPRRDFAGARRPELPVHERHEQGRHHRRDARPALPKRHLHDPPLPHVSFPPYKVKES